MDTRCTQGQKPHRVRVNVGGGIDGGCEGNNKFDETLRSLTPKILKVICVKWKDQPPNNVEKLKSAIDNKFEYVVTHLYEKGFKKNVVKREMKTERSKMKGWFLSRKKTISFTLSPINGHGCVVTSQNQKWKRRQRMANARKHVKR